MIDLNLHRIKSEPHDGRIYLLYKLTSSAAFFACDGDLIYAEKTQAARTKEIVRTSHLTLSLGVELRAIETEHPEFTNGSYNMIHLQNVSSNREIDAFCNICVSHAKAPSAQKFEDFFYALMLLFRPETTQSKLNAIGLFGELTVLSMLKDEDPSSDPGDWWQTAGSKSKYDFTLDEGNIEVKSVIGDGFSVCLKHEQLFNDDNNHLSLAVLENNPSGQTIRELADELRDQRGCFASMRSQLMLEKQLLRIDEKDLDKRFKARKVLFYHVDDINQFESMPARVSGVSYTLNLVELPSLSIKHVLHNCRRKPAEGAHNA